MGVPGYASAACVGWTRAAADLQILVAMQEPWPPPKNPTTNSATAGTVAVSPPQNPTPHPTTAGAAAGLPAAPDLRGSTWRPGFDVALKLGFDMDSLATSVCPARVVAVAAAGRELFARLSAPDAASSPSAARPPATDAPQTQPEAPADWGHRGGSSRESSAAEPGPAVLGAAAHHGGTPERPGASSPSKNPVRIQWEAALQLGGLSRLVLLPADGGRALQFRLASAEAHAASAELAQLRSLGDRALQLLPPRCGGLSIQVGTATRLCSPAPSLDVRAVVCSQRMHDVALP